MDEASGKSNDPVNPAIGSAHQEPEFDWRLGIFLMALTLAVYLPAMRAGFVWDDDYYLTNNSTVQTHGGLPEIWVNPRANVQYYPLVFTSFWLEYRLWGLNPAGYHLVNILLHAGCVFLFWRLLVRLKAPGAWFAAALFALHPVEVESVAWITERKNVLSTFLFLAALSSFVRFYQLNRVPGDQSDRRWTWYWAGVLLFALALCSKTVTCSLPAVLLLLIWWKRDRLRWADVAPLTPLLVMGLGMALLTAWVEHDVVRARDLNLGLTAISRVQLGGRAALVYLSKLIWPANLSFVYPKWIPNAQSIAGYAGATIVLGGLIALWLARKRIGKGPFLVAALYLGTLLPTLGIIDIFFFRYSFVSDHFQYLSSMAAFAGFAALLSSLLGDSPGSPAGPALEYARMAIQGVCLIALGTLTYDRMRVFQNAESLWRDTLAKNEGATLAYVNLSQVLSGQGRFDESSSLLDRAMQLEPGYSQIYTNKAYIALQRRDYDATIRWAKKALAAPEADGKAEAYNNLGIAYLNLGHPDLAKTQFEKSVGIQKNFAPGHLNRGIALQKLGLIDEARSAFEQAISNSPQMADAHFNLAELYYGQKKWNEAAVHYRAVISLKPGTNALMFRLIECLSRGGNQEDARRLARRLVELMPDSPEAKQLLAKVESIGGAPSSP